MGRTKRKRIHRSLDKAANASERDYQLAIDLQKYLGLAGWRNGTQLSVRAFPFTGRGVCSKTNIRQNDLLISLPLERLISLQTLDDDLNFKNTFDSATNFPRKELSFQALVAFYVVFHQHSSQSRHNDYIKSIPSYFTNPYFCSKSELNFLPDLILEKIVAQNDEIKTSYEMLRAQLINSICECCTMHLFPEICDLNRYKWAYFAVNSRCVYVDPDIVENSTRDSFFLPFLKDRPKLALAPFLDLFNHSDLASITTKISTNVPPDYELYTLREYRAYEQIFISYGLLSNFKLLVEYGFYLPNNQHDFFEFNLHDIEVLLKSRKVVVHRNKFKFIKEHNLDEQMFVHCEQGASYTLIVVLYLLFVEKSVFPNILSEVAFGSSNNYETAVKDVLEFLVQLKVEEYEQFIDGLQRIEILSESGNVVLGYLKECILYLKRFLELFR